MTKGVRALVQVLETSSHTPAVHGRSSDRAKLTLYSTVDKRQSSSGVMCRILSPTYGVG